MSFKNSYLSYVMMNTFYSMSFALLTSLIAVYLTSRDFLSTDVAIVVSMGLLFSIVSQPLIGYLNDHFNAKKVNIVLLLISIGSIFMFLHVSHIIFLAVTYAISFAMINGVNPAMEKMATTSPFRYGTIRIWGTIGFAIGVQLAGIIHSLIGAEAVYLMFMGTVCLAAIGLWGTQGVVSERLIEPSQEEHVKFLDLFKNKTYLLYLLMVFFFYGAPNVSGTYIPNMLIESGLTVSTASTVVFIAVLCEFPLVFFSYLFMDKVKSKVLLMCVFGCYIIQFLIFAFIPSLIVKIIATLLFKHTLGMTFIMTNLKVIKMIIPSKFQISALGIVGTVSSIAAIILQNIAGWIIDNFGFEANFMMCAACVTVSLVILPFVPIHDKEDVKLFM